MTEKPLILVIHQLQSQGQQLAKLIDGQFSTMVLSNVAEAISLFKIVGYKTKVVLIHNKLSTPLTVLLTQLKNINNSPEFIALSDQENLQEAVELMKLGAFDYVPSPIKKWNLLKKISLAVDSIDYTKKLKELTQRIVIEQSNMELKWSNTSHTFDSKRIQGEIVTTTELMKQGISSHISDHLNQKLKAIIESENNRQNTVILIVEDDDSIRNALHALLKDKFTIFTAATGKACKAVLNSETIDLVLLDIYLPDTTGILLMDVIKKTQQNCSVVVMTAYREIDIAIQALQLGAKDYINKPFLEIELLQTIAKCLQLQYFQKILPRLQNWVTENIISSDQKMSLLNECSKKHLKTDQPLKMKDFYSFFPELRSKTLPDDEHIPSEILEEGFLPFVETLKNNHCT